MKSKLCSNCKLNKGECKERGYCLIKKTLEYLAITKVRQVAV
jgi:hypothetical protein